MQTRDARTVTHDEPPAELRIIALLFILGAFGSVVHLVLDVALLGRLHTSVAGLLGFWVGRGLLRGERTWRAWALVLSSLATCFLAFFTVLMLWPDVRVEIHVLHVIVTDARASIWYAIALPGMLVSAWQWRVLMRPAIRRRFVPGDYADGPEPLLRALPRAEPS